MDEKFLNILTALQQQSALMQQQIQAADERHQAADERHQEQIRLLQQFLPNPAREEGYPQIAGSSRDFKAKNLADAMEKFSYDPENNAIFETWYARYQTIFTTDVLEWPEPEKIQLLLQKFSTTDYQRFADSILPQVPSDLTLEEAVKLLKTMFGFTETKFSMRFKCFSVRREESESYREYGARINKLGEKFDVANFTADDCKTLLFVSGLKNPSDSLILEKLLNKLNGQQRKFEAADEVARATIPKLKVSDLINEALNIITLKSDKGEVCEVTSPTEVNAIQNGSQRPIKKKPPSISNRPTKKLSRPCKFCGGDHWDRDCDYKQKQCSTCFATGHKTGFCKNVFESQAAEIEKLRRKIDSSSVHQITGKEKNMQRKFVTPTVNGFKLRLQLDSASDITVISSANWHKLGKPSLKRTEISPSSASGDPVHLWGSFSCCMSLNDKKAAGTCYVSARLNLLGNDLMTSLGLWNVPLATVCNMITESPQPNSLTGEVKEKFPMLFSGGLGRCNKTKASLTLKSDARPVFRKARSAPFAAMPAIEAELERQLHEGVYSPVEYSDFAAPIVVVKKKNGKIRICGDYSTGLNDLLEPNKFPLPSPEQIFTGLSGKKIFSKIDLTDAFFQIELDEKAKRLLTINTHMGLFTVNRLQQGVKTAPGIFQELMAKMLSGVSGAFALIDDIILGGANEEEHREILLEVLSRIQDYGFKLKVEKCEFGQTSICFCGHVIDPEGIRPDPKKIQSILSIPRPEDITQLRSFLGAVNYYGKFVSDMKQLRGPLDELTHKDVKFVWKPEHEKAFTGLKKILASDLILTHFDPKRKIIVAADASSYGKSGTLMHEFPEGKLRPIFHVSQSFNSAERNYPQIQREAAALIFAVKRFHKYIYGRKFELHTDHKPLLAIFGAKSGIPQVTASRLQRYALVLLAYEFDIKYINTKSFGYADMMSRLIASNTKAEEDMVIASILQGEADVKCFAIDTAQTLPIKFKDICGAQQKCSHLKKVAEYISQGWPESKKTITDPEVAKYFDQRHSLILIEECIFFGDRAVIPVKFRKQILEELHRGHPGIVRMKLLARSKVFWPQALKDIENVVKSCQICAKSGKSPIKCSLQSWPVPSHPWSRLHIDFAGPIDEFWYFVIVDAYSKWPEVFKTRTTSAAKTVEMLEETFARHGLCNTIVSDNGPQFTSQAFAKFCEINGIKHIRTAPYHPQSNGQAEKFVDTLKVGLLKATGSADEKLRQFLSHYRSTPSYSLGMKSPAELMSNRIMRSNLDLLKPPTNENQNRNTKMEKQFNTHHGAKWKSFETGDKVFYQLHKTNESWQWTAGEIIDKTGSVNYKVKLENERIVNAHSNQLKLRFNQNLQSSHTLESNDDDQSEFGSNDGQPVDKEDTVNQNDSGNSDIFEDAEETVYEGPENPQNMSMAPAEPSILRRSARNNLGIPPNRFGWDQES